MHENKVLDCLCLLGIKASVTILLAIWHCTAFLFSNWFFHRIMAASPSGIPFCARSKCFCVLLANCDPLSLSARRVLILDRGGAALCYSSINSTPFILRSNNRPHQRRRFAKTMRVRAPRSASHTAADAPEGNSFQSYYMRDGPSAYRGRVKTTISPLVPHIKNHPDTMFNSLHCAFF
jgi:hypothetical protein